MTEEQGNFRRIGLWFGRLSLALLAMVLVTPAQALPKEIIILRHGEKHNAYALCAVGQQRSLALREYYLGKGAADSLFPSGSGPAGVFVITLHTLELASPTAQSWGVPLQLYSVVPIKGMSDKEKLAQLNQRTQEAAHDVLTNPKWDGKVVVMVWEHDHIAKKKLEKQFPNEKVTLRQLLNLDKLPKSAHVPKTWSGSNYDYFWIVDYANPGSDVPTGFRAVKQVFPKPYQDVPQNDWGKPEGLPRSGGCKQKRLMPAITRASIDPM